MRGERGKKVMKGRRREKRRFFLCLALCSSDRKCSLGCLREKEGRVEENEGKR